MLLVAKDEKDSDRLRSAVKSAGGRRSGGRTSARVLGRLVERIRAWDADGDGSVSREEVPERYRERVSSVDTNRDGTLSKSEIDALERRGR